MNAQESKDAARVTVASRQSPAGDGSGSSCEPSPMPCHAREDMGTTTVMPHLKIPAPLQRQEA